MSAQKGDKESNSKGESFEEMITPYVIDALEAVKNGTQFVFEEAPDVIRQYVMFAAVSAWSSVILGIAIIFIGVYVLPRRITTKEKPSDSDSYRQILSGRWIKYSSYDVVIEDIIYYVANTVGYIIGTAIFLCNILDAIKITFFPKLYLVETFIHLIK